MRIVKSDKFDLAMMLQFEYWLERAMDSYDPTGAVDNHPFMRKRTL